MAQEKEKKRKRASGEPTHAVHAPSANLKAGEILRQARIAKGLELQEISSAIHVRVGQLKALEENHLDALPGMTYALGFLKSYATYLKLDATELATKFKAENGASARPIVHNTETIGESKMPDPFLLGVTGVGVLVIALIWAVFSGGDDEDRVIANAIPPAPVIIENPSVPAMPSITAATEGAVDTSAPIATGPLTTAVTPVANATPAAAAPTAVADPNLITTSNAPLPGKKPTAPSEPETDVTTAVTGIAPPPEGEVINISRGKSRVTLRATATTWVQVTDGQGRIVVKRVMRAGDVYSVPDGPGYSLVTTNAGGLEAVVDGNAKKMGARGDILRGVPLNPDTLKGSTRRKHAFQE
ncbi:MAG: helix-turn-helix domain-containing protein [Alphaproteobacteria bacterium]|nr:helix-turn-helix domain-containing protein [Alphaproteobacteria bacterium]